MDQKNSDAQFCEDSSIIISEEWLEQRFGAASTQNIMEEIARADKVANDAAKKNKVA